MSSPMHTPPREALHRLNPLVRGSSFDVIPERPPARPVVGGVLRFEGVLDGTYSLYFEELVKELGVEPPAHVNRGLKMAIDSVEAPAASEGLAPESTQGLDDPPSSPARA